MSLMGPIMMDKCFPPELAIGPIWNLIQFHDRYRRNAIAAYVRYEILICQLRFLARMSNTKTIKDYLPLSKLPSGDDQIMLFSNESILQNWEPFLRKINNRKDIFGFDAWYLNLAHMAFTSIPDTDVFGSVRDLERLTRIDLSFNKFKALHDSPMRI